MENSIDFIKNNKIIITVSILIIIAILIIFYMYGIDIEDGVTEGLWRGSEKFCTKAEIDGMLLYLGPVIDPGLLSYNRKAYLIIYKDNEIIVDNKFIMTFNRNLFNIIPRTFIERNISLEEELKGILPQKLNSRLYLIDGRLILEDTIKDGDNEPTCYADLYKDNSANFDL